MMNQKSDEHLMGTFGEQQAQRRFGSVQRALAFYRNQVFPELNEVMQAFIREQEFVFLATADSQGHADSSFRAGPRGFIHILSATRMAYPEYRGNGVMASVGNLLENSGIGMLFIDFFKSTVGLHVNGTAQVIESDSLSAEGGMTNGVREASLVTGGLQPECWIIVDVKEAYIHCSKHIPLLEKKDKLLHWGTDEEQAKRGNFFSPKT